MTGSLYKSSWRNGELVAGLGLVIVSLGTFYLTRTYPTIDWSMGGPPGFYPRLLGVILLILALMLIMEGRRKPTIFRAPDWWSFFHVACGLGVLMFAATFMRLLGFRLVTVVVCFVIMLVLSDRRSLGRPTRIILLLSGATVCSFVLGYAFEDLAGRRLPAGTWLQ